MNLEQAANELHDGRLKEAAMAEWARKWGPRLVGAKPAERASPALGPTVGMVIDGSFNGPLTVRLPMAMGGIVTVDDPRGLSAKQSDFLFASQREMFDADVAVLGLTHDLRFVFLHDAAGIPRGTLAWRPNDDGIWVQLAYVDAACRRQGIFRKMVAALEAMHRGKEIGFGTKHSNEVMRAALVSLGYAEKTRYFWKGK